MERIVVGVDGSENSIVALRWAAREANLRHASLEALIAWHYPYTGDIGMDFAAAIETGALEGRARQSLEFALSAAISDEMVRAKIERIVAQDVAANALIEAAKGADLLVVGSRGRGGFRGLVLGSVSTKCVHHAPCTVVVVPCPN